MPSLSAKVFRTYNASITLQAELKDLANINIPNTEQVRIYNEANRTVAVLCNHQRTVPKGHDDSVEKIQLKLNLLQSQIIDLKEMLSKIEKGKEIKLKDDTIEDPEKKKEQSHMFSKQPTEQQVKNRIEVYSSRFKAMESTLRNKVKKKLILRKKIKLFL